jgi:mitogen-activated protein kinase organizer 1
MTGSYDKTLSFWDLRSHSRDPIQTLSDFQDSVTSIVSPSSSSSCNGYVIAGSIDGKLRSYDMRVGLMHVDDLKDPITCIRMAANEKVAVSMCLGGCIRVNEITTGKPLQSIQGGHVHDKYKAECCVSSVRAPKGSVSTNSTSSTKIFSASEDGRVVCYDFITGKILYNSPLPVHNRAISSIVHHHKDPFFVTSAYDGSIKCWNYNISN